MRPDEGREASFVGFINTTATLEYDLAAIGRNRQAADRLSIQTNNLSHP
jgi:hypothetical protein